MTGGAIAGGRAVGRRASISIRDAEGRPIPGAEIEVYLNGRIAAYITSSGDSTIEVSDPNATIDLTVSVEFNSQRTAVPPGKDHLDVIFLQAFPSKISPRPGGRCPDGTTGQPCVICQIGPDQVRVCG